MEAEVGAHDVVAQQTKLLSLSDSGTQSLNSQRILGTDVYVAVACACGQTCDHHAFQHSVGVALHDGAVHKCAGVAFVAVTYNVLGQSLLTLDLLPLLACGEAAAATAAETGLADLLNDQVGIHIKQSLLECGVAADGNVLTDRGGVDLAAVLQNHTGLACIEGDLILLLVYAVALPVCKALDMLALADGFFYDLLAVFDLDLGVQPALRVDTYQGAHFAEAVAAALFEADGLVVRIYLKLNCNVQTFFCHKLLEAVIDLERSACNTACTCTDDDLLGLCAVCFDGFLAVCNKILSVLKHGQPPV